MKNQKLLSLILFALFAGLAVAFGQTNAVPDATPPSGGFLGTIKPLEFLLVPVVTVFIQLVRKFVPQIPSGVWPYVAPFIGAFLDWLASKFGLWTGNAVAGAMLGGLGTWFHQLDSNGPNLLAKMLPEKEAQ